jgi:excisionase family DNA binding protein
MKNAEVQNMEERNEGTHESLVWNVWPDVGKRLNLSKTTTWKMIHTGQIPSIRLGKRYVVPKAALEKVLAGGWQPPEESR